MSIGSDIKGFFSHLWDFITQTAKDNLAAFEAKITPEIWQAAEQGVIAVFDEAVVHDTAARDAAIAKAKAALTEAGHDFSALLVSDWNALVELVKQSVTPPVAVAEPVSTSEVAASTPPADGSSMEESQSEPE